MTAVDLGPVRPLCVCGAPYRAHLDNGHAIAEGNMHCNGYTPQQDWPTVTIGGAVKQYVTGSRPPLTKQLLADVAAGIRVLVSRDGVAISEEQILERARNIVSGLTGNFEIKER